MTPQKPNHPKNKTKIQNCPSVHLGVNGLSVAEIPVTEQERLNQIFVSLDSLIVLVHHVQNKLKRILEINYPLSFWLVLDSSNSLEVKEK